MAYIPALAQRIFPSRGAWRECAVVGASACVLALLAGAASRLGPAPQLFGSLLAGSVLGFWRGSASASLVVLASPATLLSPSGGFLLGSVGSAALAGLAAEHGLPERLPTALAVLAAASAPVLALGPAWLASYHPGAPTFAAGLFAALPATLLELSLTLLMYSVPSARAQVVAG